MMIGYAGSLWSASLRRCLKFGPQRGDLRYSIYFFTQKRIKRGKLLVYVGITEIMRGDFMSDEANIRCTACGSKPIDGHLSNCRLTNPREKVVEVQDPRKDPNNPPTYRMIKFALDLIAELGHDVEDHDFEVMTYAECSKLIGELKREKGD